MFDAIIGIATGISVGAAVVSFLANKLSESERRTQDQMLKEYQKYAHKKQSELNRIRYNANAQYNDYQSEYEYASAELRNEYQQKLKEDRANLIALYKYNTDKRIKSKQELKNELRDVMTAIREARKEQGTTLRMNALDQLMRELMEGNSKLKSYIYYLKRYKSNLKNYYNPNTELPKPFEFYLPENWLYDGKLFFMKKKDIKENDNIYGKDGMYFNSYTFDEFNFLEQYDNEELIPLMAGGFNSENKSTIISAKKGLFKNTVINTPRVGIKAEVVAYDEYGSIELNYENIIKLKLPKRNLENPKRTPFIGSELRVFPIKWHFNLIDKFSIEVSEKTSDSLFNYSFDNIPLVVPDKKWSELEEYMEKNNLFDSEDEWKIAPADETTIPNITQVKFQLGTDMIFLADVISPSQNNIYFIYNSLLNKTQIFKPEDIFVPIDCCLNVILKSEIKKLPNEIYENMTNLAIMVFNEFKLQNQIKLSQEGMQYFNKWAEVNDKLIRYLYKGKNIEANITKIEKEFKNKKLVNYKLYFSNPDEILEFTKDIYENSYRKNQVEFFIEPEIEKYLFLEFSEDCEYMIIQSDIDDPFLNSEITNINIFHKNFSYAETQQSVALNLFRLGKLTNSYLKICALDSSNITSQKKTFEIKKIFNQDLNLEDRKKEIIRKALSEKNIFLIQGPPGTGKTMIIREMILQYLNKNKFSNILIVSQTNVAVDNVLKDFVNKIPKKLIRCGNQERINNDIEKISFNKKYEAYVNKILKKQESNCNKKILNKWIEIIDDENSYNPDIGELIMKGHNIIGATCVGLAKKRIGLDRMEFDLVIIDEAGKALPAEILIPYIKAKKIIIIGDHKQLPPTIHPALLDNTKIEIDDREIYNNELFDKSFFYRMFENTPNTNKTLLDTQYRMPSIIGTLVSNLFYEGKIKNADSVKTKKSYYFKSNLNLIDMSLDKNYKEIKTGSANIINTKEAEIVFQLFTKIRAKVSPTDAKIAIITPYKGQKRTIINTMLKNKINLNAENIDINTIDAFQGDESEIVIFCTTRSIRPTKYFSDYRRINVALSRTKNELIILGSKKYFKKYNKKESVLPEMMNYIMQYGNIIDYRNL